MKQLAAPFITIAGTAASMAATWLLLQRFTPSMLVWQASIIALIVCGISSGSISYLLRSWWEDGDSSHDQS